MRKILLLFSLLLSLSSIRAQYAAIPDVYFGAYLNSNGFSSCLIGNNLVGWQLDTTCNEVLTVKTFSVFDTLVRDLTGINYFDSLQYLECGGNYIANIPDLPTSLQYFSCHHNRLSSIPPLPSSITYIDCQNNYLVSLPVLPPYLRELHCNHNNLISLPILPDSLSLLHVNNNSLSSLPSLPQSLRDFECSYNSISVLPQLPDSIYWIDCSRNLLQQLPFLPNTIFWLDIDSNQISSISALPTSLTDFFCAYNSNLSCLPFIPENVYYNFDLTATNIHCKPNEFFFFLFFEL